LTDGGVAHVTEPEVPAQPHHVLRREGIAHETGALLDVEGVGERDDARGVLPAVLDGQQALVDLGGDVDPVRTVDADESAHGAWQVAWGSLGLRGSLEETDRIRRDDASYKPAQRRAGEREEHTRRIVRPCRSLEPVRNAAARHFLSSHAL